LYLGLIGNDQELVEVEFELVVLLTTEVQLLGLLEIRQNQKRLKR
jgi:hypothetical protein